MTIPLPYQYPMGFQLTYESTTRRGDRVMVRHGAHLWARHPHIANDLSVGERAADGLKHWFGTWTALGATGAFVVLWLGFVTDPGELRLNLGLSCVAAVQGIILQISANRGDRLSAQVALHTESNTDELMAINHQQLEILTELRQLRERLGEVPTAPDGTS